MFLRKCASFALEQTNVLRKGNASQVKSLKRTQMWRSGQLICCDNTCLWFLLKDCKASTWRDGTSWDQILSTSCFAAFILVYFGPFEGHNVLPTVAATSFFLCLSLPHTRTLLDAFRSFWGSVSCPRYSSSTHTGGVWRSDKKTTRSTPWVTGGRVFVYDFCLCFYAP